MSVLDTAPRPTGRREARLRLGPSLILIRLTLLELRRSPMPLMLPLVALLFWFDALRTGQNLPAVWTQRAAILPDHVLPDLGPIAAGMAAWIGGREHRRGMRDLAESTARPRWLRELATWAGALAWTLLAYAACVTVVYVLAARVVAWGGPPVWPVVVIGLAVGLFCTTGFVVGALFPSRYSPPLAAIGTFFVSVMVFQTAVSSGAGWTLLSPNNQVPPLDRGLFHPIPQGLSIVQTLFLTGAIALLLGVLGVAGSVRGARMRRTAGPVLLIGAVACAVAFGLATTATTGPYGYNVPALDGASVQQISYTPVCTRDGVPVCVHPALSGDLGPASAAFGPVLDEVAGLPGAPTRAEQIDAADFPGARDPSRGSGLADYSAEISLATAVRGGPVLEYGFDDQYGFTQSATSQYLRGQAAQIVFGYVVAPNGHADQAQQAVEAGLSQAAGASMPGLGGASVAAAGQRFAALGFAQRHTWLVANLARLRAGQVTLEELP
jgi:hypothetical protein